MDPKAQQCGWLKDRYGLSWQIVPTGMEQVLADPESPGAQRAMNAMLKMKRIDITQLRRAHPVRHDPRGGRGRPPTLIDQYGAQRALHLTAIFRIAADVPPRLIDSLAGELEAGPAPRSVWRLELLEHEPPNKPDSP